MYIVSLLRTFEQDVSVKFVLVYVTRAKWDCWCYCIICSV